MQTEMEHTRDPGSDHHIRCYPDESKEVPIELKAGGVVFFAYGTPHCTKGNKTNKNLPASPTTSSPPKTPTPICSTTTATTVPGSTGPEATGGLKEYGHKLAGTFQAEVEKAIAGQPPEITLVKDLRIVAEKA